MPVSAATAILFANEGCPSHSLLPPCLESVLGDPALLWQLCALPPEVKCAYVLAGQHVEKVAKLVAAFNADAEANGSAACRAACRYADGLPQAILELLALPETAAAEQAVEQGAQVLLLNADQPLVGTAALKQLAGSALALAPRGQPPSTGPVSLSRQALHAAARQLFEQRPQACSEDIFSHILKTVRPKPLECDPEDLLRVKTRRDLAKIQGIARGRIVDRWLDAGVAFADPGSAYIGPRVVFAARGVAIEPQVRMDGRVVVGEGTTIGQGSVVQDSSLGANIDIKPYCMIHGASIGDGARIGPFARLREGSQLASNVHLGNFVETKEAHMHQGVRANHLAYLGDCDVGENTNIGAGCITCNYDGFDKHRTILGKNVFIGSDCQLVAPVTVGDGAILAAGTTLTSDAPRDALVLARPETTMREGGAERLRARLKKRKEEAAAKG
jgi:bifunctional UDP-N-acetylglucosamine pyrophosphorylase/glucosamine-1-phosphate N-acetyltransferase